MEPETPGDDVKYTRMYFQQKFENTVFLKIQYFQQKFVPFFFSAPVRPGEIPIPGTPNLPCLGFRVQGLGFRV